MANTMQADLVAPERKLASVQATQILVPGAEGDMTVMPGHAPTITSLRPGKLIIMSDAGEDLYIVTGGFAEISEDGIAVLAERAMTPEEFTPEIAEKLIAEARKAHVEANPSVAEMTAKMLADMEALGDHMLG